MACQLGFSSAAPCEGFPRVDFPVRRCKPAFRPNGFSKSTTWAGAGNWLLEEKAGESVASWLMVRNGQGGMVRPRVHATFPRRGRFQLAPLVARSSVPFGLATRSLDLLPATEVIVLPRPARVDGERLLAWLSHAWSSREHERRKVRRVVEREAEVHGLAPIGPATRRAVSTGKPLPVATS